MAETLDLVMDRLVHETPTSIIRQVIDAGGTAEEVLQVMEFVMAVVVSSVAAAGHHDEVMAGVMRNVKRAVDEILASGVIPDLQTPP